MVQLLPAGAVLHEGLALHMVLQMLETLNFMYTSMRSQIYHRDHHTRNVMLHLASGSPIPDAYLIDFGRAADRAPAPAQARPLLPPPRRQPAPPAPTPDVAINEAFRTGVLIPVRERAAAVSSMRPKLFRRVGDLLRFLAEEGGRGPWDVVEVDGRDPALRVRGLLLCQTWGSAAPAVWRVGRTMRMRMPRGTRCVERDIYLGG
jgi:hypothetical protein